jgi:hypothetical protein
VLKRARQRGGNGWLDYVREQVDAWQRLLAELEGRRTKSRVSKRHRTPSK